MPWYLASLLANLCIIVVEYINRETVGGFSQALLRTFPFIFVAQWCLFTAWNGAPHWLTAWVVFAIGNSLMRVLTVHVSAGHEVTSWPLAALGIGGMLASALVVKEGLQ